MSIQSELTRIYGARNVLRNKGVDLGVALATDSLTQIATKFDGITNRGAITATVMEGETFTIPEGYHSGSGTVSGVPGGGEYELQHKTVTPIKAQIDVAPDAGYFGLSGVTVNPIPDMYQDVSAVTAGAADVLATRLFVRSNGELTPGTMLNNGAVAASIDGLTITSYTIPAGYHDGSGTVNLTNDIENALAAI